MAGYGWIYLTRAGNGWKLLEMAIPGWNWWGWLELAGHI